MYIRKKMKIKIDRKFTQCTVYIWNWTPPLGKLKNLVSKKIELPGKYLLFCLCQNGGQNWLK